MAPSLMGRKLHPVLSFRPINIVLFRGLGHGTEGGGEMRAGGVRFVPSLATV
jgi:hypothetical protein